MNPLIQLKTTPPLLLSIALCCFALSPSLEAGCPNPPGVCGGQNTAVGENALANVTTGVWNVGVGVQALFSDTDGNQNTGVGYKALFSNVSGDKATAVGSQALFNNTTGNENVAVGFNTLFSNIDGNRNTGMGYRTLAFNASGNDNTAIGWNALFNNRGTAGDNTATGSQALLHNNDGVDNTAVGSQAMQFNVSAFTNVAVGAFAAQRNDSSGSGTAIFNTAVGGFALQANVDGARNTAVGTGAMEVANGGNDNTAVGEIAGIGITTHSHIIAIGSGVTGVSSTFGEVDNSAYIGSAFGQPVAPATGISLAIDADGKLGTFLSSRRFKKVIKPMGQSSEAVLALKPVTFQYNYDKKGTPQFGLIGEEVAEVNPNLVVRDKNGEVLTVRYEAVNAMLLNEFLKEHRKNEEQQSKIFQQDATIAHQQKQIDALTAGLQKVSAQLEASKPAGQVVNNP